MSNKINHFLEVWPVKMLAGQLMIWIGQKKIIIVRLNNHNNWAILHMNKTYWCWRCAVPNDFVALFQICDLNKSLNNGKFWAGCQNVSHFNTLDTRYQIRSSCVLSSIRLIYSKAFLPSKCVYLMQEQHQNEMYCIVDLPISSTYFSNKLISHICTSAVSSWLGFILI